MKALLAAAIALACTAHAGQQSFRVTVDAVRVDVLVTDGNRPVTGLTAADFELRDSGIVQRLDSVWIENVPLSVMLALDASSSVRGEPLDHLKSAARAVVDLLEPGDRGALLAFSEELDLFSDWTAEREQLHRAIAAARPAGNTSLHDAAYAALTFGDPEGGRPLVLIFSDGDDTTSWLPGSRVLDAARRTDAVVYGIGLHSGAGPQLGHLVDFRSGLQLPAPRVLPAALTKRFLPALAEETGGKYWEARSSADLPEAFVRVLSEFRSRYVLSYSPAGVPAGGWHPLEVRVKGRSVRVVARRGYSK